MSNVWPSSDLFELMEGLEIIETRGEAVRLSPVFQDFMKSLDSKMVRQVIVDMISEEVIPAPEKETYRVYFFRVVVMLWDSSLPEEENETAALFLSAFSWSLEMGVLPALKEGGK